tara:strand:- start:767 stop:913 length:147 start_codon:yes stop_codon:yes gene_type:complete
LWFQRIKKEEQDVVYIGLWRNIGNIIPALLKLTSIKARIMTKISEEKI